MPISLVPAGRTFVRSLIARSVGGTDAENFAVRRWGAEGLIVKSAIGATTAGEMGSDVREFFDAVKEKTIIGRMHGLRRVPWRTRMVSMSAGSVGYWVGESNPRPISKAALEGSTLQPLSVSAIVVATKDAVESGGELAEAALQTDIQRAVGVALDEAFIAASNAGIAGQRPASITNGATPISSSGNPAADIADLIAAFDGDISAAYLITHPTTAAKIALARDVSGGFEFPDCGPRGGSLLGIPLLVSRGSPVGQIALVDPTGIALGFDDLGIQRAQQTSLLMADNPESGGAMVNLFQVDGIAWKATLRANWQAQVNGGVTLVTGADYAAEA